MERPDPHFSSIDDLIGSALSERLGPPPSARVWESIERKITRSPTRRAAEWLGSLFQAAFATPLFQSAVVVGVLAFVAIMPGIYLIENPAEPVRPTELTVTSGSGNTPFIPPSEMRPARGSVAYVRNPTVLGKGVDAEAALRPPAALIARPHVVRPVASPWYDLPNALHDEPI